jgi:D-sedoheptulose 7-phosphate isomerase
MAEKDFMSRVEECISESIEVKRNFLASDAKRIVAEVAAKIVSAYKKGRKVIWFGNGGSAADAQHLSAELLGKFYLNRAAIPSISLTTNTSSLTAIANDYGYEVVFKRQVEAQVAKGDVVIGITTSGKSKNVIEGLKIAMKRGAVTVCLCGAYTSELEPVTNYLIEVPSKDTARIQETHIMIGHIICDLVESTLFAYKKR